MELEQVKQQKADPCSLLQLPDEVLLQILQYVTTADVLKLSRLCRRLRGLLAERSLWRWVDLRPCRLCARALVSVLRHVHDDTRQLSVQGHVRRGAASQPPLVTPHVLSEISKRCTSLADLRLERCRLDADRIAISQFPPTLGTLSLRGSEMINQSARTSVFQSLDQHCAQLHTLNLSRCSWLDSHALLALSKLPELRRLSFRGCVRFGGMVAYSSIACLFGFRKLEHMDVRWTKASLSDVGSFSQLPCLQHLLMEPLPSMQLSAARVLQECSRKLPRLTLRGVALAEDVVANAPPDLRWLDINGCVNRENKPLSDTEQERIRRALPECEVHYHSVSNRRAYLSIGRQDSTEDFSQPPPIHSKPSSPPSTLSLSHQCTSQQCIDSQRADPDSDSDVLPEEEEEEDEIDWASVRGGRALDIGGMPIIVFDGAEVERIRAAAREARRACNANERANEDRSNVEPNTGRVEEGESCNRANGDRASDGDIIANDGRLEVQADRDINMARENISQREKVTAGDSVSSGRKEEGVEDCAGAAGTVDMVFPGTSATMVGSCETFRNTHYNGQMPDLSGTDGSETEENDFVRGEGSDNTPNKRRCHDSPSSSIVTVDGVAEGIAGKDGSAVSNDTDNSGDVSDQGENSVPAKRRRVDL